MFPSKGEAALPAATLWKRFSLGKKRKSFDAFNQWSHDDMSVLAIALLISAEAPHRPRRRSTRAAVRRSPVVHAMTSSREHPGRRVALY